MKIIAAVGGAILKGQEISPGVWMCSPKDFAQFVDETEVPNTITILGGTQILQTVPPPEKISDRQQIFIWLVNRYSEDYLGGEPITKLQRYDGEGIEEEVKEEPTDAEQVVY